MAENMPEFFIVRKAKFTLYRVDRDIYVFGRGEEREYFFNKVELQSKFTLEEIEENDIELTEDDFRVVTKNV